MKGKAFLYEIQMYCFHGKKLPQDPVVGIWKVSVGTCLCSVQTICFGKGLVKTDVYQPLNNNQCPDNMKPLNESGINELFKITALKNEVI